VPVRERELLILFYLPDQALEECAHVQEIPPRAVKSGLVGTRRLMRDQLIEKGHAS
jgi:DNA-directed RNA polymerase specialized sigma24 family protein